MDWDKLQIISYFFFGGVVLVLGLGLGVPYYQALQEIRADEVAFFSSPIYCSIQDKLCNGTASTSIKNLTYALNSTEHYSNITVILLLCQGANESWRYADGSVPTPEELASGLWWLKKSNISASIR